MDDFFRNQVCGDFLTGPLLLPFVGGHRDGLFPFCRSGVPLRFRFVEQTDLLSAFRDKVLFLFALLPEDGFPQQIVVLFKLLIVFEKAVVFLLQRVIFCRRSALFHIFNRPSRNFLCFLYFTIKQSPCPFAGRTNFGLRKCFGFVFKTGLWAYSSQTLSRGRSKTRSSANTDPPP